jgi:hypothetical protein
MLWLGHQTQASQKILHAQEVSRIMGPTASAAKASRPAMMLLLGKLNSLPAIPHRTGQAANQPDGRASMLFSTMATLLPGPAV